MIKIRCVNYAHFPKSGHIYARISTGQYKTLTSDHIYRPKTIILLELLNYYAFEHNSQNKPIVLKIVLLIAEDYSYSSELRTPPYSNKVLCPFM